MANETHRLRVQKARLLTASPAKSVRAYADQLTGLEQRLQRGMAHQVRNGQRSFAELALRLELSSPLSMLNRGYALVENERHEIVCHASQVETGDAISIRFASSKITANVTARVLAQD